MIVVRPGRNQDEGDITCKFSPHPNPLPKGEGMKHRNN
jgi:hypothetical protein